MFSAILIAAMWQTAAINSQRDTYLGCLGKARETAKVEKIAADGFEPYARTNCAAAAADLKAALIAFDVKNKISRKQADADAQVQLDDFIAGETQVYQRNAGAAAPQ